MWLRDCLAHEFTTARVLTYGYLSKLLESESFQDLEAIGGALHISMKELLNANSVSFPSQGLYAVCGTIFQNGFGIMIGTKKWICRKKTRGSR